MPPSSLEPAPLVQPDSARRWLEWLAFSNALPAAIAAALCLSAGRALEASRAPRWALLAASGTLVVYGLDRLRDQSRDRATAPLRTRFVESNTHALVISTGLGALGLGGTLFTAPSAATALCIGVGLLGLFHRRLKGHADPKALYVTLGWVTICVGVPWLADGGRHVTWIALVYTLTLAANLTASNLDDPSLTRRSRPDRSHSRRLAIARTFAVVGGLASAFGPAAIAPLVWIPLAEAVALFRYRKGEYHQHLAIDGALLLGALASLIHLELT